MPGVPQAYKVVAAEAGRPLEEIIFLSARLTLHDVKAAKVVSDVVETLSTQIEVTLPDSLTQTVK